MRKGSVALKGYPKAVAFSYEYPLIPPRPALPFSDPEGVDGNIHTNWLGLKAPTK